MSKASGAAYLLFFFFMCSYLFLKNYNRGACFVYTVYIDHSSRVHTREVFLYGALQRRSCIDSSLTFVLLYHICEDFNVDSVLLLYKLIEIGFLSEI